MNLWVLQLGSGGRGRVATLALLVRDLTSVFDGESARTAPLVVGEDANQLPPPFPLECFKDKLPREGVPI